MVLIGLSHQKRKIIIPQSVYAKISSLENSEYSLNHQIIQLMNHLFIEISSTIQTHHIASSLLIQTRSIYDSIYFNLNNVTNCSKMSEEKLSEIADLTIDPLSTKSALKKAQKQAEKDAKKKLVADRLQAEKDQRDALDIVLSIYFMTKASMYSFINHLVHLIYVIFSIISPCTGCITE